MFNRNNIRSRVIKVIELKIAAAQKAFEEEVKDFTEKCADKHVESIIGKLK